MAADIVKGCVEWQVFTTNFMHSQVLDRLHPVIWAANKKHDSIGWLHFQRVLGCNRLLYAMTNSSVLWHLSYAQIANFFQESKAPITPDEDHEDRTASWKFWWTHRGLVKMEKCAVFKFILRLYYVPARFSLRLTRLCQVLTTSNTFLLISYHTHYHVCTTSNALLLRSYYGQSDRTKCLTFSLRPSGPYKYCTTCSTFSFVLLVFVCY